jgi:hypothetical protein
MGLDAHVTSIVSTRTCNMSAQEALMLIMSTFDGPKTLMLTTRSGDTCQRAELSAQPLSTKLRKIGAGAWLEGRHPARAQAAKLAGRGA